jgi:cobalt-zinc-cadmium efflux system outer membrane protein
LLALALLAAGCLYPVREKIEFDAGELAAQPIDVQPAPPAPAVTAAGYQEEEKAAAKEAELPRPRAIAVVPADLLPAGPPPSIDLGPVTEANKARREAALNRLFPQLAPLGPDPVAAPGPDGRPLTLADLQAIGMRHSPALAQAVAAAEAARGAAYQAGLWPNPIVGLQTDTIGTTGGAGYQGAFVEQLIKTGGKPQVTRAIAAMDLRNAELAVRRTQTDLTHQIRGGYFQVLVAKENVRISRILAQFAERVYETQLGQARRSLVAPYEPMYLRALLVQSRGNLVQAHNRYVSAWKQLAAVMGVPAMPLTELAGGVAMPVPVYDYEKALAHVVRYHTDVLTAQSTLHQAKLRLQLAKLEPYPDVNLKVMVQRDFTGPPFEVSPSLAVSVPVPVWNRNQGGIRQAQAQLVEMADGPQRARNELTVHLTEAFERYRTNRVLLEYSRNLILPDLVRVYNGVYERYRSGEALLPGVPNPLNITAPGFNDVVVAQTNLAAAVAAYVTNLGAMWQAAVDVADLLQTNDFFQAGAPAECPPVLPPLSEPRASASASSTAR